MERLKTVGILGGMGAAATADLFYKIIALTDAKNDQQNIPLIIDNNTQIPDRTAFILDGKNDPLPELIKSSKRLKNSGCEAMAIACNTAHFFADKIQEKVDINIIHIAKVAINAILLNYPNAKDIAVIATTGTKKARIYDDIIIKHGLNSVDIPTQDIIMSCIYDGAKSGKTKQYAKDFENALSSIKADIFIAACTEIPLFLPYLKKDYVFVDATLELAKQIIAYSKGEK